MKSWRASTTGGSARGEEFPGAKGSLTVAQDEPAAGQSCLKLAGDFTGGGAYVAAIRNLTDLEAKDVPAIRLQVKSDNADVARHSTGRWHRPDAPAARA